MSTIHMAKLLDHYDLRLVTTFPTAQINRKGSDTIPLHAQAEHLRWMIAETRTVLEQGRIERASRWLGFIEGSLVHLGLATLEDIMLFDVVYTLEADGSSFPGA